MAIDRSIPQRLVGEHSVRGFGGLHSGGQNEPTPNYSLPGIM
jgi:hypothetical protein